MRLFSFLLGLAFLWSMLDQPVLGDDVKAADVPAKIKEQIRILRTSTNSRERHQAARELGKIGAPAVAALRELLHDPTPKLRAAAAWAFIEMERSVVTKALPVLIDAMRRERDEATLEALAKAIAEAKEAAVPGLTKLVQTTTGEVREMGFYSLGRLHGAAKAAVPAMIELLKHKDEAARAGAVYVLGRIGPAARVAVPAILKLPDSSSEARSAIIDAFASIGDASDSVLRVILGALKAPDPKVRSAAVRACAAFGPKLKAAVPDLLRLLDDSKSKDPGLYPQPVVEALGSIGPAAKAAGPKLLPLLKASDIEEAAHTAAALLRIGIEEKAAVAVFSRALDKSLQRDKSHIRFRTFRELERMGPAAKPLVPLLLSIVKDKEDDEHIRFQAGRILRQIDPRAAQKLK